MSTIHAVHPLGAPVISVDEQLIFIPPTGHHVNNSARKFLFFFEASCGHMIEALGENSRVNLQAGDVLILPHRCRQRYIATRDETTRLHALRLLIDPEKLPPLVFGDKAGGICFPQAGEESVEGFIGAHFDGAVHLPAGMNSEVRDTVARLRREAEGYTDQKAPGYRYRVGAACLDLIVLLARQLQMDGAQHISRHSQGAFRVEEVREFIWKHLDTPLRLEVIATHLDISPEHLARIWKKATGTTIFDYVRQVRIERAKSLLASTDSNITQIGSLCGFSSLALFSRTFKHGTGVSPQQYRERLAASR